MNNDDKGIFSVKESPADATATDAGDVSRRRVVWGAVLLCVCGGVAYGAWRFTAGDVQMTLLTVGAAVVTGLSLMFRIGMMKDKSAKPMSPLRIVLNIIVAAAILAGCFYFYARGIDNMIAP